MSGSVGSILANSKKPEIVMSKLAYPSLIPACDALVVGRAALTVNVTASRSIISKKP